MKIDLRRAKRGDIPVLIELERKVAGSKFYVPMLAEQEWLEALKKDEVYLIELDGAVVGNLSYEMKASDHAYFSGFVVNPAFQGKGAGKKAIGLALERLKSVPKIDLVTHPENEVAIYIYESFGFKKIERIENYFGDGEPRVRMVLEK